jgi:hypothetical protein
LPPFRPISRITFEISSGSIAPNSNREGPYKPTIAS